MGNLVPPFSPLSHSFPRYLQRAPCGAAFFQTNTTPTYNLSCLMSSTVSSQARLVVIDDSEPDSQIQYIGQGWFQRSGSQETLGTYGPPYLHSLHGTNENASLSFTFQGTSVTVIGTTDLKKTPAGVSDPMWECFVDKTSIGATAPFEFPENNMPLCSANNLNDGPHEITVNVTTTGRTFWLDSIQYTPSPSLSLQTAVLLVDNSDSGIVFDSTWQTLDDRATMTQKSGATARFNFTGTSISWVGLIPNTFPRNASSATYLIDGESIIAFPLNTLGPSDGASVYNQVLFTTPDLPAGPHTLLVTYHGNSQQTPLILDYLYVTNTSSLHLSPSPTPNPSSSPQPSKGSSHVGAIVGGVVGGVAFIALILALFWWYSRRARRDSNTVDTRGSQREVTPFTTTYGSPSTQKFQNISALPINQPVVHEDSGLRLPRTASEPTEDVPPSYAPN